MVIVAVVGLLLVHAAGGRWFVVESPSMGRAAPVGTLVVTMPAASSAVRVGEIVSFRPPTDRSQVFTHRAVSIGPGDALRTRGDINGTDDPWTLHDRDLVGTVVLLVPGLGWVLRGLPMLCGGAVALLLITAAIPSVTMRSGARVLGSSLLVAVTLAVLKPLISVQVLTTEHSGASADVLLVSTGLLPVRAAVQHGGFAELVSGQLARVPLTVQSDGRYLVSTALNLEPSGWALLCTAWLTPLLWVLLVGLPTDDRVAA